MRSKRRSSASLTERARGNFAGGSPGLDPNSDQGGWSGLEFGSGSRLLVLGLGWGWGWGKGEGEGEGQGES